MKPLYDRYRIIKKLLAAPSLITTIVSWEEFVSIVNKRYQMLLLICTTDTLICLLVGISKRGNAQQNSSSKVMLTCCNVQEQLLGQSLQMPR